MKSRTSFFNGPVFRKDLTRFAPAWGIYSVVLLLAYAVVMMESSGYYRASSVAELTVVMALVNFGYAFLNVQLLFGDLFSARMCNALHAMPLRRECWYGTHLASGLAFSLVPNWVLALLGLVTMDLGPAWSVPLYWLLGSTLQYLCFFGIGVLCVMLTGNRFAATVVYGLINFFSVLVYWLVESLYSPLLTGLRVRTEPFLCGSPLVQILQDNDLVNVLRERVTNSFGDFMDWQIIGVSLGEDWGWLSLYALIGVAFLALGLVLYRRRALECAGDFMAFRASEPVLLIVYTITVGGVFYLFSELFGTNIGRYLLLTVGLVVGFFTGLMLLQRTTRVFRKRSLGAFAIFAAVFAGTLLLTWADPLGLTRWVPEAEQVASVNLSTRYTYNGYSERGLDLTEPEDIEAMISAHERALGKTTKPFEEPGYYANVTVCLEYTLKNGRVRTRFYEIPSESEAGQLLKPYFSSFEYVTGFREEQIPEMAQQIFQINAMGTKQNMEEYLVQMQTLDFEQMLRSIAADCAAGTMAQEGAYHLEENEYGVLDWDRTTYLEFGYRIPAVNTDGWTEGFVYLGLYPDAVHTLDWLVENGLYDPEANLG